MRKGDCIDFSPIRENLGPSHGIPFEILKEKKNGFRTWPHWNWCFHGPPHTVLIIEIVVGVSLSHWMFKVCVLLLSECGCFKSNYCASGYSVCVLGACRGRKHWHLPVHNCQIGVSSSYPLLSPLQIGLHAIAWMFSSFTGQWFTTRPCPVIHHSHHISPQGWTLNMKCPTAHRCQCLPDSKICELYEGKRWQQGARKEKKNQEDSQNIHVNWDWYTIYLNVTLKYQSKE